MPQHEIAIEDPRDDDVRALLEQHLIFARGQVPPEDAHALDIDELADPAVAFYALRIDHELLAVGALKRIDEDHAELKSMHTDEGARGRGLGRAMLSHLLDAARDRGFTRVSLETGSALAFAPARSLYASAGFSVCEPFGDYRLSPNSTYMTLKLDLRPAGRASGMSVEQITACRRWCAAGIRDDLTRRTTMTEKPAKQTVKRVRRTKPTTKRHKPEHSAIAERAYFIHLEEGVCDEIGNWLRAERELAAA